MGGASSSVPRAPRVVEQTIELFALELRFGDNIRIELDDSTYHGSEIKRSSTMVQCKVSRSDETWIGKVEVIERSKTLRITGGNSMLDTVCLNHKVFMSYYVYLEQMIIHQGTLTEKALLKKLSTACAPHGGLFDRLIEYQETFAKANGPKWCKPLFDQVVKYSQDFKALFPASATLSGNTFSRGTVTFEPRPTSSIQAVNGKAIGTHPLKVIRIVRLG